MHSTTLETIESQIHFIRNHKVMLDSDLASLYGVPTFRFNRAVKRNISRFPGDFMFQLTSSELSSLISQIGISNKGRGGRRFLPYVFTEQGVAMLSSVLNSDRAIQVNIAIMRVFAKVKELWVRREHIAAKVTELEERVGTHDRDIAAIFSAIRQLIEPRKPRRRIGFKPDA